jgi:hypothetical protein
MDLMSIYTAVAGILFAGLGIIVRQFFVWIGSKNLFKNEKLKQKLLEIIEKMSVKGIAVSNQEFVDRLRRSGQWQTMDEKQYEANKVKALTIARNSVIELLTVTEWKLGNKLFGADELNGVIESVILEQLRKSKDENVA